MIRTYRIACHLPAEQVRELNRESGRIYTATLVHHYRTYRQAGKVWLHPMKHVRILKAFCGETFLHAHSYQAAQQDFYEACKTAKELKKNNPQARYPYKRKFYHTTTWKNTGITVEQGRMRLALARGHAPIYVDLPAHLAVLPQESFRQVQLVYSHATKRSTWHITMDDGIVPAACPAHQVMAVDLGEIHPAACTNGTQTTIIACRELRANAQHRNKKTADLQEMIARCQPGSRRWKKLTNRRKRLQDQTDNRQRDMLHKVSRAVVEEAQAMEAGTIVIGDVRDVADKTKVERRLSRENRQKISQWPHGQLRAMITYKAAAEGISTELINEAYTSQTCPNPQCGHRNKPKGRRYVCAQCGYVGHRDNVGCTNILSQYETGQLGQYLPCSKEKYRHPVRRGSVVRPDTRHVACASKNPRPSRCLPDRRGKNLPDSIWQSVNVISELRINMQSRPPLDRFPLPSGTNYRTEAQQPELLHQMRMMGQELGRDLSVHMIAGGLVCIAVPPNLLLTVSTFLRERLGFAMLSCLSGVDMGDHLEVVYHLNNIEKNWLIEMKVPLPSGVSEVESVVALWPTADWQEREAFDMFGLQFNGHPDLRRILTDDEFEGFPLLKSFRITPFVAHDTATTQGDPTRQRIQSQEQGIGQQRVVSNLFSQGNQERLHPGTSTFGDDQFHGRSFPPITWQHDSSGQPERDSKHPDATGHS